MTSILIESTNSTIEPPHMRINSRFKNLKKEQEIIFSYDCQVIIEDS